MPRGGPAFERVVLERGGVSIVGLGRAELQVPEHVLETAFEELIRRRGEHRGRGVAWGYLLGVERAAALAGFEHARDLVSAVERDVVAPIAARTAEVFRFSFAKAHRGPPLRESEGVHHEGLHIDTHPELTPERDLLRVLVNLAPTPRRFRFGRATRDELSARGLYTDRGSYDASHLESEIEIDEVAIPAREGRRVSFLLFWASIVPHVGVGETPGFHLCSFEAVARTPYT